MGSLKDALKKAGFQPTRADRPENRRPKKKSGQRKKIHTHQEHRNFCESCSRTTPDVECYEHTNRTLDAKWLCVRCADDNSIPDEYRTTNQSEYSRKRIFRREYGRTKRFPSTRNQDTNKDMKDSPISKGPRKSFKGHKGLKSHKNQPSQRSAKKEREKG